jgi:hypothetical protein
MEYALKASGFARGNEKNVEADWDAFAKHIGTVLDPSISEDLQVAVDYLLTTPPKKQVLKKNIAWLDSPPDNKQSLAQQVLSMVRRVRNNLFHGGKFMPVANAHRDRDELLVKHSLVVLRACIPLNHSVERAYRE